MKLHVLHDAQGRILAAVRLNPDSKGPVPRPIAARGQRVRATEIEVPEEMRKHDLSAICQTFRVDAKRRTLVQAGRAKPAKKSVKKR